MGTYQKEGYFALNPREWLDQVSADAGYQNVWTPAQDAPATKPRIRVKAISRKVETE